jgi:hypothetical protein
MNEQLELPPPQTIQEMKSQDQLQNQPVSLAFSETVGVIFLGLLCIMLFKAYRKLLEKYADLLKQSTVS